MYRLPEAQKEIIRTQVREMLDNDIITPSKSPWNAPLLVVPKKAGPDGEKRWRVVVDFRYLNEVTVKDAFPLPRIEEILDQLGHSRYFTTLDLASGYHQVLVEEEDQEKTAFSTNEGHYEFKRMPFGLTGAPATFQRVMNHILTGLQSFKCFVYLDDIVVYGKNLAEHNSRLREVFERIWANNLKLKPEKCQFLRKEVIYLGHKCSREGAMPDPTKTECVQKFPAPRTVRQVQSFLGLVNYYRKFIPDFSKIASPINALLRKNAKFRWTDECQQAFTTLKGALVNPPLLAYPDFYLKFNLTTDASNEALGAVLSQGEIGSDRPISYASRSLNSAEKRYSTIEKEFLAVVWAVRNFRCYLLGRKFTVYTDHKPLKGVHKSKDPTSRIARFQFKLAEYDFDIEYKPGKYNTNADALSRIPTQQDPEGGTTQGNSATCLAITRGQTRANLEEKEQIVDKQALPATKVNEETRRRSEKVPNTEETSEDSDNDSDMSNEDPEEIPRQRKRAKRLTSRAEIETILHDFHDAPLGGHEGMWKTYKKIRRQFRWKGMMKDIATHIKKCAKCQKNKCSLKVKSPMQITDAAAQPFEKVYMDIVGPLEETIKGNKYILTFEDDLTRFMDCYPMPDMEAATVARIFFDEIITRYRIPKKLITDQGSNFTSELFKRVCKFLKIKKIQTTAYHPESNGALERSHRPLVEYLKNFTESSGRTWDEHLRAAMFVRNNSQHRGTKLTPMDCLYGFTAEIPTSLKRAPEPVYNSEDYFLILRNRLQRTYQIAQQNLLAAKGQSKVRYDKNSRPLVVNIGEKVMLKNPTKKGKLAPEWLGPYIVCDKPSDVNTIIRIGNKTKRVHNNRLKKYYE